MNSLSSPSLVWRPVQGFFRGGPIAPPPENAVASGGELTRFLSAPIARFGEAYKFFPTLVRLLPDLEPIVSRRPHQLILNERDPSSPLPLESIIPGYFGDEDGDRYSVPRGQIPFSFLRGLFLSMGVSACQGLTPEGPVAFNHASPYTFLFEMAHQLGQIGVSRFDRDDPTNFLSIEDLMLYAVFREHGLAGLVGAILATPSNYFPELFQKLKTIRTKVLDTGADFWAGAGRGALVSSDVAPLSISKQMEIGMFFYQRRIRDSDSLAEALNVVALLSPSLGRRAQLLVQNPSALKGELSYKIDLEIVAQTEIPVEVQINENHLLDTPLLGEAARKPIVIRIRSGLRIDQILPSLVGAVLIAKFPKSLFQWVPQSEIWERDPEKIGRFFDHRLRLVLAWMVSAQLGFFHEVRFVAETVESAYFALSRKNLLSQYDQILQSSGLGGLSERIQWADPATGKRIDYDIAGMTARYLERFRHVA